MIHAKRDLFRELSFHDEPITGMVLDSENKILKISLRGARILDASKFDFCERTDPWLGNGVLIFKNWSSLEVYRTNEYQGPRSLGREEIEEIEELLLFEEGDNFVKFAGFGVKSGYVDEWKISNSEYYGEFEEYELEV